MPGIDPEIAMHRIPLDPSFKPVKQKLRRMKPEIALKIKEEIAKQLDAGFITVSHYPEWVANVVPVLKKDGRVRMCVDFRDLNKASPKDNFPLPHIDILVDNTANHAMLSFMDGYAGYNQILMAPEDREKTTFITQWGTFCYRVMPFGLINAGATYQRTAVTLLHDLIHKEVEVYVDDMIVKSKTREGHLVALRRFFERLRKYKMRLNPQKCAFGVTSGKLLGYVVSTRGIEVDPSKIKAILEMPPPQDEKQIRGFLGRLQYIGRFISKLTMTCEPIFKKLKKEVPAEWDELCQEAFEKIKQYLQNPPVLVPPRHGIPLKLYLTVTATAAGAMLAQDQDGEERAIYYISKKFLLYEVNYTQLEKTCLALVWASKKLRHYLLTHTVHIVSHLDPLKYLFEKPALNGRLSRWIVMLAEFDLKFVPQKSIKGRAISDFLADNPSAENRGDAYHFPDESIMMAEGTESYWDLYFDGASNQKGYGVGALLVSPEGAHIPFSVKLDFEVTNNAAEYEACIMGLEAAVELGVKRLNVYGDSSLIINHTNKVWKVRNTNMMLYQEHLDTLVQKFDEIYFTILPRDDNQFADALAKLASMVNIPNDLVKMTFSVERRTEPAHCYAIEDNDGTYGDGQPWFQDILNYKVKQEFPPESTPRAQKALRTLAAPYQVIQGQLYRMMHGARLLCVNEKEAKRLIEHYHNGVCGPHMNGKMLSRKISRQGYYWITMEKDCHDYVKKCPKCQKFANLQHLAPSQLYSYTSPWPFSAWGIDIIGKITPKGAGGHEYVLVAIDYFTKWVEAASYRKITSTTVAKFLEQNIFCRYGVPYELISDQGTHFRGDTETLLKKFKVRHHRSSPYRPQMNGAVEAANKNIKVIIEKMAENYNDWPNKLHFALWGYRTSIRTSTGVTPYSLVFGMEAVQPIELEIPSLRIALESQLPEAEWVRARYEELIFLDERRLNALHHVQVYQRRVARHFNKRVKSRNIHEGDLVLKEVRAPVTDPRGKFRPNWSGPYVVKAILSGGAVKLADVDGAEFSGLINMDQLKRYYS